MHQAASAQVSNATLPSYPPHKPAPPTDHTVAFALNQLKLTGCTVSNIPYNLNRLKFNSDTSVAIQMAVKTSLRTYLRTATPSERHSCQNSHDLIRLVLRQRATQGNGATLPPLDLRGVDLRGVDLTGANLSGVDLSGADLSRAKLAGANMAGAVLFEADLTMANMEGAKLTRADLTGAIMECVDLTKADLIRANLTGANLNYANLRNADLSHSIMRVAHLLGADLRGANLEGANLEGANLSRATLDFKWPLIDSMWDDSMVSHLGVGKWDNSGFDETELSQVDSSGANLGQV